MQKKTQKLDLKIQEISSSYKELIKTQFYIVKKNLIDTIRKLCAQAIEIIENDNVSPENLRKRRQVEDMLKRSNQIEQKIDEHQKNSPTIGSKNSNPRLGISKQTAIKHSGQKQEDQGQQPMDCQVLRQKSIYAARSMIFYELTSQHIQITTEELDKLAIRIQNNHQVMKQMEMMVIEQGGNLQKVQQSIKQTYQNVVQANQQLDQAKKQQTKYFKLRMKVVGFLGGFGYLFMGIKGLIVGLFGGLVATQ